MELPLTHEFQRRNPCNSTQRSANIDPTATVLVVEDDENILKLLSAYIESAGYEVVTAANGDDGLQKALSDHFDICILDVMLPDKSGVEIASKMKEFTCSTPILFLTALGNESDVLRGFDAGADDYMIKPFSPRELMVRIAAILKRMNPDRLNQQPIVHQGPITLDESQALCSVNGSEVELTPHEYRILKQLIKRPNQVFERRSLIASIYGNEDAVSPKAIDVHVHHLRSKLDDEAGELIKTVRGFGYKFCL